MAHIEFYSGKPLATGAEIVEPFHLSVCFDKHVARRTVANRLAVAQTTHNHPRHIFQIVYLEVHRALKPPMVENWDEKIRTRSGAIALPDGLNSVVSKVRHQISDLFATEPQEMMVHGQRIDSQRNHTSDTVRYFPFLQQP